MWKRPTARISHFQVPKSLTFKTRLNSHSFEILLSHFNFNLLVSVRHVGAHPGENAPASNVLFLFGTNCTTLIYRSRSKSGTALPGTALNEWGFATLGSEPLTLLFSRACFSRARLRKCRRFFFPVCPSRSESQAFLAETVETGDKNRDDFHCI